MRDNHRETVILPSDFEEWESARNGESYTKRRSGYIKIYTPEEVIEFAKIHPETVLSFGAWKAERDRKNLVDSASCILPWNRS